MLRSLRSISFGALVLSTLPTLYHAKTVPATNNTYNTRVCQPPYDTFPFCDTQQPMEARVADLVDRVVQVGGTGIVSQLTARHLGGGSPGPRSNISSLGLPSYDWGLNCLHGVQSSCVKDSNGNVICPTSFPNSINYGFSWNRSMFLELGQIIAVETRALWLAGATEESPWSGEDFIGLDCWSPNINMNRDPRWGRNQETPSEDPGYNGDYGTLHTLGLQGNFSGAADRYIRQRQSLGFGIESETLSLLKNPLLAGSQFMPVIVTMKHFDAYSLEDSDGFTRHNFNAVVLNSTLADTYWPAFKEVVQVGDAKGFMCSYNAVNGVPMCAQGFLQKDVLRGTWGYTGYITSDTGALSDIYSEHKYVATDEEAACAAIAQGTTDVSSDTVYHDALLSAVSKGLCSMDDVKAALTRTFTVRFQAGLFDPVAAAPLWNVPLSAVNTPASEAANLFHTLSTMTLLHNNGNVLPIPTGKKIAVIGPHGNATAALVGNYLGQLCDDDTLNCVPSPYQMLTQYNTGGSVTYAQGSSLNTNSTNGFAAAVSAAQAADYVVLFLGIDNSIESEGMDRTSIDLPYIQHQLASAVAAVGKPTAVVLINGGMVDVSQEKNNANIGAIMEAGYPGMRGAEAIAMTLFGLNDHLGGKLPYTIYPSSYVNDIAMSEMEMDVGPGRSYRFYTGTPVYPFGWGISLTTFSVTNVSAPSVDDAMKLLTTTDKASRVLSYSVNVTNTGSRSGDEVVFAFMVPQELSSPRMQNNPLIKQLVDYQRVHLLPGESQIISLGITSEAFRMVTKPEGHIVSTPGTFKVLITNGVDQSIEHTVQINGDETIVEYFPGTQ